MDQHVLQSGVLGCITDSYPFSLIQGKPGKTGLDGAPGPKGSQVGDLS